MTLLGNFDSMSGQEENEPFIWNERSKRSMIGRDPCSHREGRVLEMLLMPFILLQSMLFSPCSLVRTKFPNRVIHTSSLHFASAGFFASRMADIKVPPVYLISSS